MNDFLAFRRMLMPLLIQVVFWVGVVGCLAFGGAILAGVFDVGNGGVIQLRGGIIIEFAGLQGKLVLGLGVILLGPVLLRLYCELLILPFRINGTLTDIRNTLSKQQPEQE